MARKAATKKTTASNYSNTRRRFASKPAGLRLKACSLIFSPKRCAFDRLRQQHLLGEDQVRTGVVRELVVVAHRDRVERAGDLAVAAEDAARHVDLVDGGVALAGADPVLGRVLGGHHADAVRGAGGGA